MGNFLEAIKALGLAVAGYFGYAQQREARKNAPDVKAAAEAAQEKKTADQITEEVADNDLEAIQRRASKG